MALPPGLDDEIATRYSRDQLWACRRFLLDGDGGPMRGLTLEAVPAEEAAAARKPQRQERKQKPIGPITECVPVDSETLKRNRDELRRIEKATGCVISEKAGLRNHTVIIQGTMAIVEKALPMVEAAFAEEGEQASPAWWEQPPPEPPHQAEHALSARRAVQPPPEPPPEPPSSAAASKEDASAELQGSEGWTPSLAKSAPPRPAPPPPAAPPPVAPASDWGQSQPAEENDDEDWEIPAHWGASAQMEESLPPVEQVRARQETPWWHTSGEDAGDAGFWEQESEVWHAQSSSFPAANSQQPCADDEQKWHADEDRSWWNAVTSDAILPDNGYGSTTPEVSQEPMRAPESRLAGRWRQNRNAPPPTQPAPAPPVVQEPKQELPPNAPQVFAPPSRSQQDIFEPKEDDQEFFVESERFSAEDFGTEVEAVAQPATSPPPAVSKPPPPAPAKESPAAPAPSRVQDSPAPPPAPEVEAVARTAASPLPAVSKPPPPAPAKAEVAAPVRQPPAVSKPPPPVPVKEAPAPPPAVSKKSPPIAVKEPQAPPCVKEAPVPPPAKAVQKLTPPPVKDDIGDDDGDNDDAIWDADPFSTWFKSSASKPGRADAAAPIAQVTAPAASGPSTGPSPERSRPKVVAKPPPPMLEEVVPEPALEQAPPQAPATPEAAVDDLDLEEDAPGDKSKRKKKKKKKKGETVEEPVEPPKAAAKTPAKAPAKSAPAKSKASKPSNSVLGAHSHKTAFTGLVDDDSDSDEEDDAPAAPPPKAASSKAGAKPSSASKVARAANAAAAEAPKTPSNQKAAQPAPAVAAVKAPVVSKSAPPAVTAKPPPPLAQVPPAKVSRPAPPPPPQPSSASNKPQSVWAAPAQASQSVWAAPVQTRPSYQEDALLAARLQMEVADDEDLQVVGPHASQRDSDKEFRGQIGSAARAPAPAAGRGSAASAKAPLRKEVSFAASPSAKAPKPKPAAKSQAVKALNPLPQRNNRVNAPAPVMYSQGLAISAESNDNAASSRKWAERPVEKLVPYSRQEEEDDPELACYLWDRKAQKPLRDQARRAPAPVQAPPVFAKSSPAPNAQKQRLLLHKVCEMGFDEQSARRALTQTGWAGVEEALGMLLG